MLKYLTIACLSLVSLNLGHGSTLKWDRTEVDLEMKPDQEEIQTSFNVTNKGDDRIRIARVKTSCGCTGSIIDRKILQPGESTEIIATFNKGKRQGLNRLDLEVFIDSQAEAVANLRMNVQIPKLVEAMPQIVYWTSSSSKSPRQIMLELDKRYVDQIESIEYDSDQLNVSEQPDPKRKADRILKISPKSYDSLYRGTITINASGRDGRKADAKIMVFVQP